MGFEYFPDSLAEVRSDEGFEVIAVERFTLTYREGERQMDLYCEDGRESSGEYVLMLGTGGLKSWISPFENEIVSEEKQKQIRSRIVAALEFMGVRWKFLFPI